MLYYCRTVKVCKMTGLLSRCFVNLRSSCRPPSIVSSSHFWQESAAAGFCTYKSALGYKIIQLSENVTPPVVPIFQHAPKYGNRVALRDHSGDYTYQGLFASSHKFAKEISDCLSGKVQERVAFLCYNEASYVIAQWAAWISGQIAVPLTTLHPPALHEYYIRNSEASLIVTTEDLVETVQPLAAVTSSKLLVLDKSLISQTLQENATSTTESLHELDPNFYNDSNAIIVYTSGTTGTPKGVVISHSNIQAQVSCLIEAWGWSENDAVLHVLPLNHIHGIVNVLLCPLAAGARCVMRPEFDASDVWNHLLGNNIAESAEVNMLMAVPTAYIQLLDEYENMVKKDPALKDHVFKTCSEKIRLMVSGSSALPVPLFQRWEEVTGHQLLERFGMSETGMVLSNPLKGKRRPGYVGNPLPGMEVQIAKLGSDEKYEVLVHGSAAEGTTVLSDEATSGDLLVRGPNVFKGYWNLPEATKQEFTEDGWFKTGDTAQYEDGVYKILGRTSVDIIKTGGYKVSAVEIETHFLAHPDILDCSVLGLPDNMWGQKVAIVIVTRGGKNFSILQLREWGKKLMAPYALPTIVKAVDNIPKNSMGKTNKKELLKDLFPEVAES